MITAEAAIPSLGPAHCLVRLQQVPLMTLAYEGSRPTRESDSRAYHSRRIEGIDDGKECGCAEGQRERLQSRQKE